MGGSGGLFGSSKQKAAGAFQMTAEAKQAEAEAINRQRAIANGSAPSIGQMAFQNNLDQTSNQAVALAASQRGVSNPALGMRTAQLANQQSTLQGAQQGAMMQEQERRAADQYLQQTAAAQRGVALQSATANQNADAAKAGQTAGMIGSLGGAAALAFSDKNLKTDIKPSEGEGSKVISEFMDALKSYTYEYKKGAPSPAGKENPGGKVTSVMAQDLEKTEMGKDMVKNTKDGKMVDYAQGMAPMLAAIAELNKKVNQLSKEK